MYSYVLSSTIFVLFSIFVLFVLTNKDCHMVVNMVDIGMLRQLCGAPEDDPTLAAVRSIFPTALDAHNTLGTREGIKAFLVANE